MAKKMTAKQTLDLLVRELKNQAELYNREAEMHREMGDMANYLVSHEGARSIEMTLRFVADYSGHLEMMPK